MFKRSKKGNTVAEFGPTLLLALGMVTFPLLAFGQLGLRYLFLLNAAELSAEQAAKSQNFKTNITSTSTTGSTTTTTYSYSAVTSALNISQMAINNITGGSVTWISTNTYIYVCPMGSTTLTTPGPNTALPAPADAVHNTYNCVVKINATIQPVFPGAKGMLGSIVGFNAPINCYAQSSRVFENTSNLNQ